MLSASSLQHFLLVKVVPEVLHLAHLLEDDITDVHLHVPLASRVGRGLYLAFQKKVSGTIEEISKNNATGVASRIISDTLVGFGLRKHGIP